MLSRREKATKGGTPTYGQARRDHRPSLAPDRAALARVRPERWPMERPSYRRQRHPVETTHRLTLARPARKVRPLAELLRSLQPLEARWHLGSLAGPSPDQERRGRGCRVGGERGRHGDPGSPARRGCQESAERGGRKKGLLNPEEEALGCSKGGFSTKVHLACDGKGRPLSVVLSAGQRHGSTQLEGLLEAVRVPRPPSMPGRLRKRPDHLLADRGYSFESCRRLLRRDGASPTPSPSARTRRSAVPDARGGVGLRSRGLPQAQRGREVREQARAVASDSDALRETGDKLPGDGGHSFADDVVALMSRQTHPNSPALLFAFS